MSELLSVWKSKKMLSAMCFTAFLYAALTIPFKGNIIIPQISEIRPSAFLPVLAGFVFGPAGAWGAAIGNLIGDIFGTFSLNSLFGFIANLGLGLIPYRLWYHLFRKNPNQITPNFSNPKERHFIVLSALVGNLFCSMTIAFGVHFISGRSYTQLFEVIMLNNSFFMLLLYFLTKPTVLIAMRNEVLWYQQPKNQMPTSTPTHQLMNLILAVLLLTGSLLSYGLFKWAESLSVTDLGFELANQVSLGVTFVMLILSAVLIYLDN